MDNLVDILYVVAFAMFIYGLMGLTGPRTAVRGNQIAAVGMAIAVIATLISVRHAGGADWVVIVVGLIVGVALGIPPARFTKMTAMPQLVAAFNGVGGGTVALISLSEFLDTQSFSRIPEQPNVHIVVGSLFAAIIGSVSFWGSLVAFGKLQEILPGRPIGVGKLQQPLNIALLAVAVAAAVVIGIGATKDGVAAWWMVLLLVAAAL
uniref:NAD(P)(+) transhydrogenase (Re/Si-specific) subunit beta n=1 Tax=Nocardia miyunensis TaxID=282684 RepID=UPI000AD7E024